MSVSNLTPASGASLAWGDSYSFEVTAGYSTLLVRNTVMGGVLEAAYDSADGGAAPGYSVVFEALGATDRLTITRDSGWSTDPTTYHVTEDGSTTSWTYDVFPTEDYPEGMQPYNDEFGSATNAVQSVFTRTGNVVAIAGDYDSDEVTNVSGVAGSTVSAALDTLEAAIPAAAPVTSVFGRTGVVVAVAQDYAASEVENDSGVTGATVADALDQLEADISFTDRAQKHSTTVAPTVNSDETGGYEVNCVWTDTVAGKTYIAQDVTTGAAVWEQVDVNDHVDLANIGTNTHAQVDTHIAGDGSDHSDVVANTAKVTNATHTGDVTGATALTIGAKKVTSLMMEDGTDGELFTWDASGVIAKVAVGTLGQVLTSNGPGAAPTMEDAASGSGDVAGPGSSTDNALAKFDGATGKIIQNTGATLDDNGLLNLTGSTVQIDFAERASGPSNTAGIGKLWANSTQFARPYWAEDGATTRPVVLGPTGAPTDGQIARYDNTSGGVIQAADARVDDSGNLILDASSAFLQMTAVRTTPPAASSGNMRLWAMADNTSGSNGTQSVWATNDNSYDQRLGQSCINISFEVSPSTSGYWRGWAAAGPYNDTLWTEGWGSGATPTLSSFYDHPPLAVLPGDTRVERVVGWYSSESTTQTWQMELMYLTFADQDAFGAIVRDTICDGSWEGNVIVTSNSKVAVVDHAILDNTCTPSDTAHMGGYYLCFRETTATKVGADLKGSVTIYYSTLTPDGWYNYTGL